MRLDRVLPPGPREYWIELEEEHKKAPAHQEWMYEADPFAARKAVEERQAIAKKKDTKSQAPDSRGVVKTSPEFANAPEAKMASGLRDLVEDCIKQVCHKRYLYWGN